MALTPACSLILNFDEATPIDASIDGPYTQAECDYKEPNESVSSPMTVTASDTGPAAICAPKMGSPEDHDFYKFTVASAMVTVAIQFTNRPGGDLDIKLYKASDSSTVAQSRGFGNGEMIVCPGASPSCPTLTVGDDYVLEVFPAVPGSVNSYTFSIMP
ncbi:MAG TPA: hypothetical protein VIV40_44265 [Kofleriaceae bacterium]